MLRPRIPRPFSFFPAIPHARDVCLCVSVGVCSAWAVGGVVVMESVLCDLWAGHQDANQEMWGRRRAPGLWTARSADQTLQHSSVSWLVASPYTWYNRCLCPLAPSMDVFFPLHLPHSETHLHDACSRHPCVVLFLFESHISLLNTSFPFTGLRC